MDFPYIYDRVSHYYIRNYEKAIFYIIYNQYIELNRIIVIFLKNCVFLVDYMKNILTKIRYLYNFCIQLVDEVTFLMK